MSKKPKGNNTAVVVLLTVLIFVMIALTGLVIWMCVNLVNKTPQTTVRTETQAYTLPTWFTALSNVSSTALITFCPA